jgi:hypothetical protein
MALEWHTRMVESLRAQGHAFAGLRITDVEAQTVEIEPAPGATPEELAALQAAIDALPLANARAARTLAMHDAYAADLADGVTVGQLTLAAGAADQDAMGHGLTLLTAALLTQQVQASTPVSLALGRTVSDFDGNPHDMTVGEYIALCLGYGQTIGAMQAQRNAKLLAIASAQTVQAVNAINW